MLAAGEGLGLDGAAGDLSLESQGLVEVRPKSGHYVRVRPKLVLSEPRAPRIASAPARVDLAARIGQLLRTLRDPGVVQLGSAIVAAELLPVERLNRMLAQIARSAGPSGIAYDPPPGYPLLRRQIARCSVAFGCPLAPDEIVTTVGASEALHLALRAVARPGDVVAVESPAYYGLLQLIESLGIRVVEVPVLPGSGMDLDALEEVLRTQKIAAVLAVPDFSNPSGTRMPDESSAWWSCSRAARSRWIEDDIYGDLHHTGERPRPAKAFDTRGLVLLCSSFTKTLAPGYRVGWIAPGRFRDKVLALKFATPWPRPRSCGWRWRVLAAGGSSTTCAACAAASPARWRGSAKAGRADRSPRAPASRGPPAASSSGSSCPRGRAASSSPSARWSAASPSPRACSSRRASLPRLHASYPAGQVPGRPAGEGAAHPRPAGPRALIRRPDSAQRIGCAGPFSQSSGADGWRPKDSPTQV